LKIVTILYTIAKTNASTFLKGKQASTTP